MFCDACIFSRWQQIRYYKNLKTMFLQCNLTNANYSSPRSHFGLSHFAVKGAYVWAAQNGLMLNGDGIKEVIPAKHKFRRKHFKSCL